MRSQLYIGFMLFSVICTGCQKKEPEKVSLPECPSNLKVFLGIRSLKADYKLPSGIGAYFPIVFFFHAGELVEKSKGPAMMSVQADIQIPTSIQLELMWQVSEGAFQKASLVDGLNELDLTKRFEFWDKFKGYSIRQVRPEEELLFDGAKILGIVAYSDNKTLSLYGNDIANMGTYVVAVGIVTGKSRHDIEDQFMKK